MFTWIKKLFAKGPDSDELEKYELTVQASSIPVADLKQHIVDGYELEKKLKVELEEVTLKLVDTETQLQEMNSKYEVIAVVAGENSYKVKNLTFENERLISNKKAVSDSFDKFKDRSAEEVNSLKIKLKKYEDKGEVFTVGEVTNYCRKLLWNVNDGIATEIFVHKGNLSKNNGVEIVRTVIERQIETYENISK